MRYVTCVSLVLPFIVSLGCSTSSGSSAPDSAGANGGGGNSSSNGGNGGGAGYHIGTSTGGASQPGTNGTTPPNLDAGCAGDVAQAQLTQVNILFLLDKSGSMGYQNSATAGTWDNCADRWNPVVDTLNNFFVQPDSGRIYASLSFLPADGGNTAICDPKSYSAGSASLKVPLTLLDATGRKKFQDRLCDCANGTTPPSTTCIVPQGGTPTRPALQGTIEYSATVAKNNPGSKTVIVLITDGMPSFYCGGSAPSGQCNSCDDLTNGCYASGTGCIDQPTEIAKLTAIIDGASGASSSSPKSIYVVGVGTDLNYGTTFEDWSGASGNAGIDLRNLTGTAAADALMTSLQSIRSSSIQCDFDVPVPKSGANVDPTKTYVYYTDGSGKGQYLNQTSDGKVGTCMTTENDFYFDNPLLPTKITLCPTACQALQQDPKGAISIEYECKQPHIIN